MLLVHQAGKVRVGEVIRYTLTYTPSNDRILPIPERLYVKLRNASPIPLRAAYLHGPYALHASCHPSTFDPNTANGLTALDGPPSFEPNLKAGGSWHSHLIVPERARTEGTSANVTWIIEVSSQILFSTSASVSYELLVGRNEKCLELGLGPLGMINHESGTGHLDDYQQGHHPHGPYVGAYLKKGVFSTAIELYVEDTKALWDKPPFPTFDRALSKQTKPESHQPRRRRKVHLVVLTHGLHSNLGADMLYLKESIDASANKAREERQAEAGFLDAEEEQVIVRGFAGNVCRTEKGIQYLGKRLAKWVLAATYPDQPCLPHKSPVSRKFTRVFAGASDDSSIGTQEHKHSTIHDDSRQPHHVPDYQITSISFIAHSLGGLTQTYAIAYIQKHSPQFFDLIRPVNFITLAAPLLGLSNENPIYVRFALDFGLVGRTGQDLGLTWKSTTAIRGGWDALIAGLGADSQKKKEADPRSKPLLRILPVGHTHQVLKKFRNRAVYSNVVNDGIVPLRTSCLLFLDWRGLGRVDKARRENGLVAGLAGWGWAELTGTNASARRSRAESAERLSRVDEDFCRARSTSGKRRASRSASRRRQGSPSAVPEPDVNAVKDDNAANRPGRPLHQATPEQTSSVSNEQVMTASKIKDSAVTPMGSLLSFLRPSPRGQSPKQNKIYQRSQTIQIADGEEGTSPPDSSMATMEQTQRPGLARGFSLEEGGDSYTPPTTTILESAGDVLDPPLPSVEFLSDPTSRPRTIFHDRVYHPDDIPLPANRRSDTVKRLSTGDANSTTTSLGSTIYNVNDTEDALNVSGMKVEEKIARAYHHGLSWRKVLVRLEPDAHNNIIVRRKFANAYGWPVIQHLVDTHFGNNYSSRTADENEPSVERAGPIEAKTPSNKHKTRHVALEDIRSNSEKHEASDSVPELKSEFFSHSSHTTGSSGGVLEDDRCSSRQDSLMSAWDDGIFEGSEQDDEDNDASWFSTRPWAASTSEEIVKVSRKFDTQEAYSGQDMPLSESPTSTIGITSVGPAC